MFSIESPLTTSKRYGLAILIAVIALALQWGLWLTVDSRIPFLFFIAAVSFAAILLGSGPAVLISAIGAFSASMTYAPVLSPVVENLPDQVAMLAYAAASMFFIALGAKVRRVASNASMLHRKLDDAQRKSASQERRFEVALDSASVPFTILDPVRDDAGKIIDFSWAYVNLPAARVLGRPADELLGQRVNDVLPGTWEEGGLFDTYVEVASGGQPTSFDLYSSTNGIRGWFHVVVSPLDSAIVVWFADITQHKQLEAKLKESDQMKDAFIATMAHELRNPLAPIRLATKVMERPGVKPEQMDWAREVIDRQARHMALLLDDLLDLSRISRGALTLRKSLCQVRTLVDSAIEAATPIIESKKHSLTTRFEGVMAMADVDEVRVTQIITNLLTNAAKYTPEGGNIELRAQVAGDEVLISVRDSGVGIAREHLDEIFRMFTQVKASGDTPESGLGIGLAVTKGLVELHGGRIEVASEGQGKGSQFIVRLPLGVHAGQGLSGLPAKEDIARSRRKVLVADDNLDAANLLGALFENEGHKVSVVYDGEAAFSTLRIFQPDIAFLDIGMPKWSGIEVAREIRKSPIDHPPILVAITGWGQLDDKEAAYAAGFDYHLTKPVEFDAIQKLMDDAFVKNID